MARREYEAGSTKKLGATRVKAEKNDDKFSALNFGWVKKIKWLPLFSITAGCLLTISALVFWDDAVDELDQEIVSIEIIGQLNYLKTDELQGQLNRHLGEGFLSLDLNALKDEVEGMPWIYSASLKRQWPGTLKIYVKEQHPVAVWNNDAHLNEYGEIFQPENVVVGEGVPSLLGPIEQAKEVLQRYVNYRERLKNTDAEVALLSLEARGAWQLRLQSGVVIKLGRDPVDEKLDRFIKVYKLGLNKKVDEIESVDARYTNGIAVRWKEQEESEDNASGSI